MLTFSAQQIAMMIQGKVEGDAAVAVTQFGKIEEAKVGELTFLANPKYEEFLYQTKASIVIINETQVLKTPITATIIRVPDAYAAFATLLTKYQDLKTQNLSGIQSPSYISPSAILGENHYVAAFAHIGERVQLGNNVKIFPNVVIGENVKVGNNVILHPGVVIYADCILGNNIIIHSGTIIGSDGFGFAPNADGSYQKVPQLGNVVIEDNVEIGSNTTIDRATIGSTIIKKGVKIDNLIQIAHNVEIGKNTVIAALTGIAGSTKIGENVMIGGQVGIAGHLTIANGVKIAAQTGISASVLKEDVVMQGTPAVSTMDFKKSYIIHRRLPQLLERIERLEKGQK